LIYLWLSHCTTFIKMSSNEDILPDEITLMIYSFLEMKDKLMISKRTIGLLITQEEVFKKDVIVYTLDGDIQDLYFAFWYKIKKDINQKTVQKWIDNIHNIYKIEIVYYLLDIISQYENIDISAITEYVLINPNEELIQKTSRFMDFKLANELYKNPEIKSNSRHYKKMALSALKYSPYFVYPTSIDFMNVIYDGEISEYFTDLMKYSNIESMINFYMKFKRAIIEVKYYNREFISWLINNDPRCVIYLFKKINFVIFIFNDFELLNTIRLDTDLISANIRFDEHVLYNCFKTSASNIRCFNILIYFLSVIHEQYIFEEDIGFRMCLTAVCENKHLKLEVIERMYELKPNRFNLYVMLEIAVNENNLLLYKFMENLYTSSIHNPKYIERILSNILNSKNPNYDLLNYLINEIGIVEDLSKAWLELYVYSCIYNATDIFSRLPEPVMMNALVNCSKIVPNTIKKILHGIHIFSDLLEKNMSIV